MRTRLCRGRLGEKDKEMYCQKSRCAPELIVIERCRVQLAQAFTGTLETCKMDVTEEATERIIREHFRPSDTFRSVLQVLADGLSTGPISNYPELNVAKFLIKAVKS